MPQRLRPICYTVPRPLTSDLCSRKLVGRQRGMVRPTSHCQRRIRTTVGRGEEQEQHSGASPLPEPTAHPGRTVHRGLAGRRADDRCCRRLRHTRFLSGNSRRSRGRRWDSQRCLGLYGCSHGNTRPEQWHDVSGPITTIGQLASDLRRHHRRCEPTQP